MNRLRLGFLASSFGAAFLLMAVPARAQDQGKDAKNALPPPAPATTVPLLPASPGLPGTPSSPAPSPAPAKPAATAAPPASPPATPPAATTNAAKPAAAPAKPVPAAAKPAAPPTPRHVATPQAEADSLLGKEVYGADGAQMGLVTNVLVDRAGHPIALVIDFGGFLGVGSRKVAIDWHVMKFHPGDSKKPVTLSLSKDQLKSAPEYKQDKTAQVVLAPKPAPPPKPAPKPAAAKPAAPTVPAPTPAPTAPDHPAAK